MYKSLSQLHQLVSSRQWNLQLWCFQICLPQPLCCSPENRRPWSTAGLCHQQTQSTGSPVACIAQNESCPERPTQWYGCQLYELPTHNWECSKKLKECSRIKFHDYTFTLIICPILFSKDIVTYLVFTLS